MAIVLLLCVWITDASFSPTYAAAPILDLPSEVTVEHGAPLHLALDGFDADGDPLTYSVSMPPANLLEATIPTGNRSWQIDVQNFGTMTFELFEGRAPRVTDRIIELTEVGFYDGIIFHRVIDDFVIQGGDPLGTGFGGSDLPDFDDQYHPDLVHSGPGILSMAKSLDDTNNSQIFITELPFPHLDFNHSVFGFLTDGEAVREAISEVDTNFSDMPVSPVVISQARVINDMENAVLTLKALDESAGPIAVDVTVSDGTDSVTRTVQVTTTPDTFDSPPFLLDIPDNLLAIAGSPLEFDLEAIDTDSPSDQIQYRMFVVEGDAQVDVTAEGRATVIPGEDFRGDLTLVARVLPVDGGIFDPVDSQQFRILVVPEPSSAGGLLIGAAMIALRRRR